MSREALQDFLRAVEHHQQLRQEVGSCHDDAELIELAQRHGFMLTPRDLACDSNDSRISRWFESSRIKPSFRIHSSNGRCHTAQ